MKVTKAKGPNTYLAGLHGNNPRATPGQLHRSLAADAMRPRKSVLKFEPAVFVGCCHGSEPNRINPFALATFIWGRK